MEDACDVTLYAGGEPRGAMDWLLNNGQMIYGVGAPIAWILGALISFFGIWWFWAVKYQFPRLVPGWLPGVVAALTAAVVVAAIWSLVAVVGLLLAALRDRPLP